MKTAIIRVKDTLWGNMPEGVELVSPYKNTNIFTRAFRKFFGKMTFIQGFINNPLLRNVDADMLLVFDSISIAFLKWLKKHNANKRIILWYWNPVFLTINPKKVPKGIELWSYSHKDCEKYGMQFNTQFCFSKYTSTPEELTTDIFFFGRDKGRGEIIKKYQKKFEELGLKTDFRIIRNKKDYIPYSEGIQLTKQSKCVLDFCVNEEVGMSLRALESLFLDKKVITNNKMYMCEKFYRKQNIFILEQDDLKNLPEFLTNPLEEVAEEVKEYYLFENWLKRF